MSKETFPRARRRFERSLRLGGVAYNRKRPFQHHRLKFPHAKVGPRSRISYDATDDVPVTGMRTAATAYPESKLRLQPTGQSSASLSPCSAHLLRPLSLSLVFCLSISISVRLAFLSPLFIRERLFLLLRPSSRRRSSAVSLWLGSSRSSSGGSAVVLQLN